MSEFTLAAMTAVGAPLVASNRLFTCNECVLSIGERKRLYSMCYNCWHEFAITIQWPWAPPSAFPPTCPRRPPDSFSRSRRSALEISKCICSYVQSHLPRSFKIAFVLTCNVERVDDADEPDTQLLSSLPLAWACIASRDERMRLIWPTLLN